MVAFELVDDVLPTHSRESANANSRQGDPTSSTVAVHTLLTDHTLSANMLNLHFQSLHLVDVTKLSKWKWYMNSLVALQFGSHSGQMIPFGQIASAHSFMCAISGCFGQHGRKLCVRLGPYRIVPFHSYPPSPYGHRMEHRLSDVQGILLVAVLSSVTGD